MFGLKCCSLSSNVEIVRTIVLGTLTVALCNAPSLAAELGTAAIVIEAPIESGVMGINGTGGDVDGDGVCEFVCLERRKLPEEPGHSQLSIIRFDENGNVVRLWEYEHFLFRDSGVADVDNDGIDEIAGIIANERLFVVEHNDSGFSLTTFELPWERGATEYVEQMAVGDMNNDGENEIAVVRSDRPRDEMMRDTIGVIKYSGDSVLRVAEFPGHSWVKDLLIEDVDGDGLQELIMLEQGSDGGKALGTSQITIYRLRGEELTKLSSCDYAQGVMHRAYVVARQGDGETVLLVAIKGKSIKEFQFSGGRLTQTAEFQISAGKILSVDYDGDGSDELIALTYVNKETVNGSRQRQIRVYK